MICTRSITEATYSPFAEKYCIPHKQVRNEHSTFWGASCVEFWTVLDHKGLKQTVSYLLR